MELHEALELLKKFGEEQKVQQGALNLVETLVKNNVPVNGAKHFCAEHFMSETIAQYYEDFFNYVASTKEKQKEVESSELPQDKDTTVESSSTQIQLLISIDNTLKEILDTLKHV